MRHALIAFAIATPAALHGATVEYRFEISVAQQVPAPALNGATPTSAATLVMDTDTRAISLTGWFDGLTAPPIAAHLHGPAAVGQSGSVIVPLVIDSATTGAFSANAVVSASAVQSVLDGLTYINIHTPDNLTGELRGQATNCLVGDVTTQGAGAGDPGFGVPDGLRTAADINYFVNGWIAGDLSVGDVTTQGAGAGDPGFGAADGLTTAADINYFVNFWLGGCP